MYIGMSENKYQEGKKQNNNEKKKQATAQKEMPEQYNYKKTLHRKLKIELYEK